MSSAIVSLKYNKHDRNWLISAFRNSKNKKRLAEKSFDPLVVHGEGSKVDAPIAPAAKDKAVTTSKNSTTSITKNNIDVKDIKTHNQLLEHRYYDDVVMMIKAEEEQETARVKRISPSDKILELYSFLSSSCGTHIRL